MEQSRSSAEQCCRSKPRQLGRRGLRKRRQGRRSGKRNEAGGRLSDCPQVMVLFTYVQQGWSAMRLKGIVRPNCPACGKELAVHSRYGESDVKRNNRYIKSAYPELADYIQEWDGRTCVTRYRCSQCRVIYNASAFGDKRFYNETKVTTD